MDNFDLKQFLVENKLTENSKTLINEAFEDIMKQLSAMALNGEIDNTQIKSIESTLMSARRQGQLATRKNSPDYAEKAAASIEKGKMTKNMNKLERQAANLAFEEMGISGVQHSADQFALTMHQHRDQALQAEFDKKYNQMLNSLQ